jgi:nucleotide-binding universal stress UspA family protein
MDQAEPYRDQERPERQRELRRRGRPVHPGQPDRRQEPGPDLAKLVHPVIVGYDGSASARNALAYAAGTARRLGRPLLAVYVTSSGVHRELLAELDDVAHLAELEVHVRIQRGSPARELAFLAAELSADALVIGAPTHVWHHLAGSVPGWLARHASCPVIVVP